MNILQRANEIINERSEEKEREYGPMDNGIERIAKLVSIFRNKEITPEDVYWVLISLKLSRESNKHKEDNLLDLVAYIGAYSNYCNKKAEQKENNDIQTNNFNVQ